MRFKSQDRLTVENKILDGLCEGTINSSEFLFMQFIARECYTKKTDSVEMSCGFLSKALNLTKRYVTKIEKSLEEKGYITVKRGSMSTNTIKIDASLWLFG